MLKSPGVIIKPNIYSEVDFIRGNNYGILHPLSIMHIRTNVPAISLACLLDHYKPIVCMTLFLCYLASYVFGDMYVQYSYYIYT